MRMPRAARFHRIKKQAKTSNGQYSAWCSEVGEKNRLTSVGFMNFGKDNRKQQEFSFELFYNKPHNWILNI